jgi:hypothetical protein
MPSDTSTVIGWFYRQSFDTGSLDFDKLLDQAVRLALGKSSIDAEAYLVRNTTRLWNELLKSLDDDAKSGRSLIFDVLDSARRRLLWLPSNLGAVTDVIEKKRRANLESRPGMLRLIDDLSDREYEALGCVTCELVGATNTLLTPAGNERGIDFLATVNMSSTCHVVNGDHKLFRIVGQAKNYGRRVEFKEVQRLTETLNEIKYQTPAMQALLPVWFRIASGPIIGWLNAHNGVQSGGMSYARNHGIMIADSNDLAEIAALSAGIDGSLTADSRVGELRIKINSYLP